MPDAKNQHFATTSACDNTSTPVEEHTPQTAVDTIFDLYSACTVGSPNSSIESPNTPYDPPDAFYQSPKSLLLSASSSIVELEDTSARKRPVLPSFKPIQAFAEPAYLHELKKTEVSRNIIYVRCSLYAITDFELGTCYACYPEIIAIESDNRLLMDRAIAAEEAAVVLKKKAESLQHIINYCSYLHSPTTASGKRPRAIDTSAVIPNVNRISFQKFPQTPPLLQTGPLLEVHSVNEATPTRATGKRRPIPAPLKTAKPYLIPSPTFGNQPDPFGITYASSPATPKTPTRRRLSPNTLSQPLASPPLPTGRGSMSTPLIAKAFPAVPHPHRLRPAPLRTSQSYSTLSSTSLHTQSLTPSQESPKLGKLLY
ncbi:hypothetical protein BJ878DRAFT_542548 [Calycina marina]|uniref:Uncharacterized protein n=1 Tax=Calycina marina TaxID=1763456 RepID=A0A9P7Z2N4_9HELO|nr:hypothetical protein BJ878DRAFT_542548 [Calycina marina]